MSEVIVDGGISRVTYSVKVLALGAKGVVQGGVFAFFMLVDDLWMAVRYEVYSET